MEEFWEARRETEGEEDVYVMRVVRHKTARQGPANITMLKHDWELVKKYVNKVHPLTDPYGEFDSLFLDQEDKPVRNLSSHIRWLGQKYEMNLPTCTELRKVAATASMELPPG